MSDRMTAEEMAEIDAARDGASEPVAWEYDAGRGIVWCEHVAVCAHVTPEDGPLVAAAPRLLAEIRALTRERDEAQERAALLDKMCGLAAEDIRAIRAALGARDGETTLHAARTVAREAMEGQSAIAALRESRNTL